MMLVNLAVLVWSERHQKKRLNGETKINMQRTSNNTSQTFPPLPAGIVKVSSDTPFEEALAALTSKHAVVFPTGLVTADPTVYHTTFIILCGLHVAAASLRWPVILISLQVPLVTKSISLPIGISPPPSHHGHLLVLSTTEEEKYSQTCCRHRQFQLTPFLTAVCSKMRRCEGLYFW